MVIAILSQTLTTSAGSIGSQALGTVHADVRNDVIESDVQKIDMAINRDIVDVLTKMNFPKLPYHLYPRFDTMIPKSVDREAVARAIKTVTSIPGINVPVSWAHEELNIPEPQEDEPVLKGTTSMVDELFGTE